MAVRSLYVHTIRKQICRLILGRRGVAQLLVNLTLMVKSPAQTVVWYLGPDLVTELMVQGKTMANQRHAGKN